MKRNDMFSTDKEYQLLINGGRGRRFRIAGTGAENGFIEDYRGKSSAEVPQETVI
jgi:hypothetical protein